MPSVIATLRVQDGKAEEAKQAFRELAATVRENEPGTLAYVPHQRADDPNTFIFYEKYESQEAFQTHGANLAKAGAKLAGVLAGRPEIVFLEEV
jgi:quinol monooxygenase YgiN